MPSRAYQDWCTVRAASLDEIEQAHQSVGGTGPGRRVATQQINQAYALLLSAQFQGFCRNLHTESMDFLVLEVRQPSLRSTMWQEFTLNRRLDRGNPTPGNIGADFNRLGLELWNRVEAHDARNKQRRISLEELNEWRNAIAHQDFDPTRLGGRTTLQLPQVRSWRSACNGIALSFDQVMRVYLLSIRGVAPW